MKYVMAALLLSVSPILIAEDKTFSETSNQKRLAHEKERENHESKHETVGHGQGEESEHEEGSRNVGPDKGVLVVDEKLGFKVREGVEDRFKIKAQGIGSISEIVVPKTSIVYSKDEYQIFRKRDGFWKAVDVNPTKRGSSYVITTKDLQSSDSIATEGVGLLKVIELNVIGSVTTGHIH